jgi:hypothetical protein
VKQSPSAGNTPDDRSVADPPKIDRGFKLLIAADCNRALGPAIQAKMKLLRFLDNGVQQPLVKAHVEVGGGAVMPVAVNHGAKISPRSIANKRAT